jgi:diguanylate cyclase (GGDEF)-like protein
MSDQDAAAEGGDRTGVFGRRRARTGSAAPQPPTGGDVDPLTGLSARAILHDWLAAATRAGRPTSTQAVLAFVDLDSLRDVNDGLGPDAGDYVLREVAGRLQTIELFGARPLRYGGAEFAVVFEQVHGADGPTRIAHAILDQVTAAFDLGGTQVTVACHVGLAVGSDASGGPADLVRDAHQALVHARDGGTGSFVVHDEARRGRYTTRIDEARMHSALENQEFLLHYQPIVRTGNGGIIGVEALLRWQAPGATNTGMLFPHEFLPLLEKSGLIVPVGQWVIRETCRQAQQWNTTHPDAPQLFVTCNVGARQLAMPDFADTVLASLAESNLPSEQLCLDITESALRYNGASTWSALRRLKEVGVKVGLDDFGTGAASLGALRELNLDLLRLDRVFIADLAMSVEDQAIVRHMTNLAHELGVVSVAEGVETPEQAAMLTTLGVDLAQGFHFGRPEAPDRIDLLLSPLDPDAFWSSSDPGSVP